MTEATKTIDLLALRNAVIEARLARSNWQKYNAEQGDEIVYQAEKMASAIDKIDTALRAMEASNEQS